MATDDDSPQKRSAQEELRMTKTEVDVTQEDVDAYACSLRNQGTPWALGCAALIEVLWNDRRRLTAEPPCEHVPKEVISGRLDATGEHYTYLCGKCFQPYEKHIAPM
jgi:hypothetical protein